MEIPKHIFCEYFVQLYYWIWNVHAEHTTDTMRRVIKQKGTQTHTPKLGLLTQPSASDYLTALLRLPPRPREVSIDVNGLS